MLSTALLTVVSALGPALGPAPLLAPQQRRDLTPPPGLTLVPGGKTKIGAELKEIRALIEQEPEAEQRASGLLGETPMHRADVADFFLMVSELTNQQYAVFVEATGHKPPMSWGQKAIEDAGYAFATEQGRLKKEAKDKGEDAPPTKLFDPPAWWNENWKDAGWAIPAGRELHPVVLVSYFDALAYARWAGLRLPTELEFQRAVRLDSERRFPWGDEFDPAKAGTLEAGRRNGAYPIGSFPGGVSEQQIFDLAGNVWEWTSSPYLGYEGYKAIKITIGSGKQKRERTVETPFDAADRVLVGGSFQNSSLAARASVRRRLERFQTVEMLGFRCAASTTLGRDIAVAVLDDDLPTQMRPTVGDARVVYRPELAIGLDRWIVADASELSSSSHTAGAALPASARATEPVRTAQAPPGYAVITGYEHVLFVPVEKLAAPSQPNLTKDTVEGAPAPLGFLTTSVPVLEPALEPGVYMISFRGAGEKRPEREKPAEAPAAPADGKPADGQAPTGEASGGEVAAAPPTPDLVELIGLDPLVDNFVFYDKTGEPLKAVPVSRWRLDRLAPGAVRPVNIDVTVGEGKEATVVQQKWLEIEIAVESLLSSKGFRFILPLRFEDGVLERDWRMTK